MQENIDVIAQHNYSTIVAKYIKPQRKASAYQSEAELEKAFIKQLVTQGYEYIAIKNENELLENLKKQLERLNNIHFSKQEWARFSKQVLCNPQYSQIEKTKMIQTIDDTQVLERDDGSIKNISLLDRTAIANNHLQVVSQIENQGSYKNRYDVSVLVNGLPLVHIELKRRGVNLKEAFNQIKRYAKESFWAGSGLFEFVQIFVISNGTLTKYYSNSTRKNIKSSSENNHYEFCISFADAENTAILDLEDFTKTFFAKRTLCNILMKYCVFNTQNELLVMRPYQIAASESIINAITIAHREKLQGSIQACGYIWHSTGSGKTLTSFKTALLASRLPFIKKVLFVVDRKDLDFQTMREYDKIQKGAVNSTASTKELKECIESYDINQKIIVTTIQKLARFIEHYKNSMVFNDEIVFIFDECHRSQFGSMHEQIIKKFKRYYLFGFTGTPIFEPNANKQNITTITTKNALGEDIQKAAIKTTESLFNKLLHSYTILHAIADKNVLPFHVEYISTMKQANDIDNEQILAIERTKTLLDEKRIHNIVAYVLEHFNQKTKRNDRDTMAQQRQNGFNALFATQSIEFAKAYYNEFQKQMAQREQKLRIAIIYSYAPNEDIDDLEEGANSLDSKEFLESAIKDYNKLFKTKFSLNNFDAYYKNVSEKLKEKELDMLIVVDMFLTGFDSKTLNTLWVDKNLRHHGLLQSFSRTNRILNSVKTFGNIVCFRDLESNTQESLKIFGDKRANTIALLRSFDEYLHGYELENGKKELGYLAYIKKLQEKFPLHNFPLKTKKEQKEFIELFGSILRLANILQAFDIFAMNDTLLERDKQDYQSHYIELYNTFFPHNEKSDISDDIVFEMELIKQTEVNVEYILFLLEQYYKESTQKQREHILRTIDSSISLHNKKDLIRAFLDEIDSKPNQAFEQLFEEFIRTQQEKELSIIINEEQLQEQGAKDFIKNAFNIGIFQTLGTALDNVLPKISLFATSKAQEQANNQRRQRAISKLELHFERYRDIIKKEVNP